MALAQIRPDVNATCRIKWSRPTTTTKENVITELPERIRAARKAAGLTQRGLARKIDTTHVAVSNWENGHRTPRPRYLARLERALGVSLSEAETSEAAPKGGPMTID